MTLHPRTDWTSEPPANSHPFVASQVLGAAVHWNGPAVPTLALTDPRAYLRGDWTFHTVTRGWSDIAYNLAVDCTGDIWILRGLQYRSAANGDVVPNEQYVAILGIIGQGQRPTPELLAGIRLAVELVRHAYPKALAIKGHRDMHQTDCPGPDLYNAVTSGALEPTTPEVDVPMTTAEQDALIRRFLGTAINASLTVAQALAKAAADPAPVPVTPGTEVPVTGTLKLG